MFRIWISRSGSIPIREQLSAQVLFGILSHRLRPGERLPSVRDLARRIKMHPNTVSAAYSDLVERGWLKRKSGSGVFVADLKANSNDSPISRPHPDGWGHSARAR
jgi:DNA-binding transcriptional regulator YhcF (GntR family)